MRNVNNICFPPGYRFAPTDLELIQYYLMKKINNEDLPRNLIPEIKVYASSPDHIAEKLKPRSGEAMYMFSSRERKYAKGNIPSRTAGDGSWKQSGYKDIYDRNLHVGTATKLEYMKKIKGKPGKGIKTKWLMAEYTIVHSSSPHENSDSKWNDLVLCKIYETPRKRKNKGTEDDDYGESHPDVIDDNDASQDVGNSLNVVRRISPLVESTDARNSKIRRVSSDQPPSSFPCQHIASSSMGPRVQISAVPFDGVKSLDQEMLMPGSQQEQSCQVPSNVEVNNLPDYDVSAASNIGTYSLPNQDDGIQYFQSSVLDQDIQMHGQQEQMDPFFSDDEWDWLLKILNSPSNMDDNIQIDSFLRCDQSPTPQGMQALSYQQEQFNQILSTGEADQIDSRNFGAKNMLNGGHPHIQNPFTRPYDWSSIPQGMQALSYQQEQFNQILNNGEADHIDSWKFGTNNILNGGLQHIQNSVTRDAQMSGHQQQYTCQTRDYTDRMNCLNMTTNCFAELQQETK